MVLCLLPLSEEAPAKHLDVSMMHTVTSAKELDSATSLLPLLGFYFIYLPKALCASGMGYISPELLRRVHLYCICLLSLPLQLLDLK